MKMTVKKVKVPLYGGLLWVVVCRNVSAAIDRIEDMIDDSVHMTDKNYSNFTFAANDNKGRYRIILFIKPTTTMGELAHECKHIVNLIFSNKGAKLSLVNDEPECYFLEKIVDMAHRAIVDYNKKYKPKRKCSCSCSQPCSSPTSAGPSTSLA